MIIFQPPHRKTKAVFFFLIIICMLIQIAFIFTIEINLIYIFSFPVLIFSYIFFNTLQTIEFENMEYERIEENGTNEERLKYYSDYLTKLKPTAVFFACATLALIPIVICTAVTALPFVALFFPTVCAPISLMLEKLSGLHKTKKKIRLLDMTESSLQKE